MSVDLQVHKYRRQGQSTVMTDVNHYVKVKDPNSNAKYYLQKGRYYAGLDQQLKEDEVPQWLKDQVKKMNPKVLEQVGFGTGGIKVKVDGMTDKERYKQMLSEGLISEEEYNRLTSVETEVAVSQSVIENLPKDEPIMLIDMSRPDLMKLCKEKGIQVSVSDTKEDLLKKLETPNEEQAH